MRRAAWNASLHPRAKNGKFRRKWGPSQSLAAKANRRKGLARAGIAAAPVAITAATSYKPIALGVGIAAANPVIGGALISAGVLGIARSTSAAREIYIGGHIRRKRGAAAHAKFLRVNARIDRGLTIAGTTAGLVGGIGLVRQRPRVPGRNFRKNFGTVRRSIPKTPPKSNAGYAKKGYLGYKVTSGPVGKQAARKKRRRR